MCPLRRNIPSSSKLEHQQASIGTDLRQARVRLRLLTVLCVCVAACVLAVCVAAMMVVDLARKRSLVLLDAELVLRGGGTEREAVYHP